MKPTFVCNNNVLVVFIQVIENVSIHILNRYILCRARERMLPCFPVIEGTEILHPEAENIFRSILMLTLWLETRFGFFKNSSAGYYITDFPPLVIGENRLCVAYEGRRVINFNELDFFIFCRLS